MCSSLSDLHNLNLAYSSVHSISHNLVFKVAENLHLCGIRLYADGDQHMPHVSAAAGEPQPAHLADDEDTDDEADREVRDLVVAFTCLSSSCGLLSLSLAPVKSAWTLPLPGLQCPQISVVNKLVLGE